MKDAGKHKILFHSLNLDTDLTNSSLAKFAYLLDGMELNHLDQGSLQIMRIHLLRARFD